MARRVFKWRHHAIIIRYFHGFGNLVPLLNTQSCNNPAISGFYSARYISNFFDIHISAICFDIE